MLLCKNFENNTPFLGLLNNHNIFDGKATIFKTSDTIQHNITFKKTFEKIKNYFARTTHFYNSLEEICYNILEFICLNVSAIRRFCTLTKEDCVTDVGKEVVKQLQNIINMLSINLVYGSGHKKMECLCAGKVPVNFGTCFNDTIRRP